MPTTKQAPGFVTQQLRHGAYWDAVPPFYAMTTLQGPSLDQTGQSTFPKWRGRHPIKIPKDLALQLLWQVAEYQIKLEFEEKPNVEGYTGRCYATTDGTFFATWDLAGLTDNEQGIIAAQNFESRELKLPQGDLKWVKTVRKDFTDEIPAFSTEQYPYISFVTEDYSADRAEAVQQVLSAWESRGGIPAFKEYDVIADIYFDHPATFASEKQKATAAINAAADEEIAKLLAMRNANEKTPYTNLKAEIIRQISIFYQWSEQIKAEAQDELEELNAAYNNLDSEQGGGGGGGTGGGGGGGTGGGTDGGEEI